MASFVLCTPGHVPKWVIKNEYTLIVGVLDNTDKQQQRHNENNPNFLSRDNHCNLDPKFFPCTYKPLFNKFDSYCIYSSLTYFSILYMLNTFPNK